MELALGNLNRFSFITIADRGVDAPAWAERLQWPSFGDDHVALRLDRDSGRGIWAAQLDEAVMRAEQAVVLVAEGVGCLATSWWARLSPKPYVSRVAGALLFDPRSEQGGADQRRLFAAPKSPLPFPSLVLAGRDPDIESLVEGWGSRFIERRRQRSRPPLAWRGAQRLIERATAAVVERDVQRARRLAVVRTD